ncbi:NAD(P)H:quinone oxidoreductase (plasmid) [Streptomyces sp. AHU1]|uniref:NAD(P)H:quinone oxidoreductase n=1 Tax=Streptomyces sp. AHU1 TaxID=3377215 RepID=UPI003877F407
MAVRVAVIYYSATGNVHSLAESLAEGASSQGAEVRLRRAPESVPDTSIEKNPAWRAHIDATKDTVQEAIHEDLEWASAYAFGTPTRYGNVSAQLKNFIDSTGQLWQAGVFHNKPVTSFTSAMNRHGGQESTLLSLNNVFYHWGCIIVPPGYTDPLLFEAGGNPYGTSWPSGGGEGPDRATLAAANYQGRHLVEIADRLQG